MSTARHGVDHAAFVRGAARAQRSSARLAGRIGLTGADDVDGAIWGAVVDAALSWDPALGPFEPYAAIKARWAVLDLAKRRESRRWMRSPRGVPCVAIPPRAIEGVPVVALDALAEPARTIVYRHYFLDEDLDEAAAAAGVSKSWASRLHAAALATLRASMEPAP